MWSSLEYETLPALFCAVHVYFPLCSGIIEAIDKRLDRSPSLVVVISGLDENSLPWRLHVIVIGLSPFDTWQINWTLSPVFISSSTENGTMCGNSEVKFQINGIVTVSSWYQNINKKYQWKWWEEFLLDKYIFFAANRRGLRQVYASISYTYIIMEVHCIHYKVKYTDV